MGLDLAFYNVKTKIKNIDKYFEVTRTEMFEKLGENYNNFYRFEQYIDCGLNDDWNIIHAIHKAIVRDRVDGVDISVEHDAEILTKKDLEDIIEFLSGKNIATKVLGGRKLVDRETYLPINVEEYYPKEYWEQIKTELEKILEWFDFDKNTLLMTYSY